MTSSSFAARRSAARAFETQLFAALAAWDFTVAQNGTEHTHPAFVQALRASYDPTSLALRFQPDGVGAWGTPPRTFYIEAKSAQTIEREAYQQYLRLHAAGNLLVIVFGAWQPWRWCFIEELPLISGSETVQRFAPAQRFPVDAEGWLCPGADRTPTGSGALYKEVRGDGLRNWASFRGTVSARLTRP